MASIDWLNIDDNTLAAFQSDWQKEHDVLKADERSKNDNTVNLKTEYNNANNTLKSKNNQISDLQKRINSLTQQMGDPSEIARLNQQKTKLQLEVSELEPTVEKAKKSYENAKKLSDKATKAVKKHAEDEPNKLAKDAKNSQAVKEAADAKKKEENRSAAKAKIKDLLSKIDQPIENIHKTVCLKAGILPSTPYAIKFCEWLKNNTEINEDGTCDWYKISDNDNAKIDKNALKEKKKEWLLFRASSKKDEEDDTTDNESPNNDATNNLYVDKVARIEDELNTLNTKLDKAKADLDIEVKLLEKLKYALSNNVNNQKANANVVEQEGKIRDLQRSIRNYEQSISKKQDELETARTQNDANIAANGKKDKESAQSAKERKTAESWWKKNLKSWRQNYLDDMYKNYGAPKMKVVPDDVTKDELEQMAKWAFENVKISYKELGKKGNETQRDSELEGVWRKRSSILSIKNDLNPELLKNTDKMTPNAARECFTGAMSNTFQLAKMGVSIVKDPNILKERAMLFADISAAALARLNNRVLYEITSSLQQLMDITPITNIPVDAAAEMLKHVWTPTDIMNKIASDMDPTALTKATEAASTQKINEAKAKVNEVIGNIQGDAMDKLAEYNAAATIILNTLNQSPDWYIDAISSLEQKYEKEIISNIQKATIPALDAKFQFVDTMVSQVAYNLVAPVNRALEEAQLLILRKIIEAKRVAIAKAKALAAAAIMKILGLLGG